MALTGHRAWARTSAGSIIAGAAVEVRRVADNSLATLYTDAGGGTGVLNPFTTEADGSYEFYAEPDRYNVLVGTGASQETVPLDLTDGRAQVPWPDRATAVADIAGGFAAADGTIKSDGVVSYVASAGATAISDLPGWLPFGDAYFDHFQANTTPGTTDMTTGFAAASLWSASSGKTVHGIDGATYLLNTMITMASGVMFDLGKSTVTLGMFTSDITDFRIDVGAVGFNMSGQTVSPFTPNSNQMLRIGHVRSALSDGQFVDVVAARNCSDVNIDLGDVTGTGIMKVARADTLSGVSKIQVYAHDLGYSTSYSGLNAANGQITGIDIDDSRVNGVDSEPIEAHSNCEELQITGAALATLGGINQTDAMTVANGRGHHGTVISKNCGESLDVQADYCVFDVTDLGSNTSLKLIHGASYNIVNVTSKQAITSGVVIAGGTLGRGPTEHNQVTITVDDVDPSNTSTATVGMVKFEDIGSGEIAQFNKVWASGVAGTNTDYGAVFKDSSADNVVHLTTSGTFSSNTIGFVDSSDRNIVHVSAAASTTVQDSASGKNYVYNDAKNIPDHGVTASSAYPTGTQNIPISTDTKVAFDAENYDYGNDYDASTNYRSTPGQIGPHGFSVSLEFNAACNAKIMLFKNGVLHSQQEAISSVTRHFWSGSFYQDTVTDYWEIFVSQPDGTRNITASATNNWFNVFKT